MKIIKGISLLFVFCIVLQADEGMWLYNQLPLETLKSKYQFEPSPEWQDHLMKSSVRFNSGGSGSFISGNGLVLTNHHVGADTLAKISTPQNNYYRDGFLAKSKSEEIQAPDLELNQLISIENVTSRVESSVTSEMTDAEAHQARLAVIAKIEKESFEKTGLRSDVVKLYQGGQYHLYRYKKYTDVRLVFSPEFDIAFFGGDNDNFEYPRFNLDMCIFRVYENGEPAQTPQYFKWSQGGTSEKDLVFVSGHPGTTRRMFTVSALTFLRDHQVPYSVERLNRLEIMLQQYAGKSLEHARQAQEDLFTVQNSRKVYWGRLRGLQDPEVMRKKQDEENKLIAQLKSAPELAPFVSAWDKIAVSQKSAEKLFVKRALLEGGQAFNSRLFDIARTLVRLADEDKKANEDRLAEFRDSNRESLQQDLFSHAPIYLDLELAKLTDALTALVTELGEDHPWVRKVLLGQSPAKRANELVSKTQLMSVPIRQLLAEDGQSAIKSSLDPMILLARSIDGEARKLRKQYEEKVEEPQQQGYAQIAKALFALKGTSVYPDATFTLRLAFGEVKGYSEGNNLIAPFTTLEGAFNHEISHGNVPPFKLPQSWHQNKNQLNLQTPFNFVSTTDIIGGNSGSPIVDKKGELVGLIFDGNIHSLVSDYFYDETANRAVSVDVRAMREVLKNIYRAEELLTELGD